MTIRRPLLVLAATLLAASAATAATATDRGPSNGRAPSTDRGPDQLASQFLDPHWVPVNTGSDQQYRGLDAVNRKIAWVGGSDGEVLRTTNGGKTWKDVSPDDTTGLLFRDVEARDARHASVMAIGEGDASRIYTTDNGGRTWDLAFVNDDPAAFYDCMDFYPGGKRGLAMSDPVNGKFRILATYDGGHTWEVLPDEGMPDAVEGEFGFAASGTCLVIEGRDAWLASGGGASRVFHSRDGGFTWTVADSTIPATPAGGVFSLAFRNAYVGIAVGGDFEVPDNGVDASSRTRDGGATWTAGGDLAGYRSGVDWLSNWLPVAIAVGPTGSDISYDGGRRWTAFDDTAYDAVVCTYDFACWASGPEGAVARLAW
jgi:photosystem II stability/assembly factor-like uncharacterized protein